MDKVKNNIKFLGVCIIADGVTYEGEFKEDKFHGIGKLSFGKNGPNAKDIYEGSFKEGKYCGFGRYCWSEGPEYIGQWADNMRNGKGNIEKF